MSEQTDLALPERIDYKLRGTLGTPETLRRYVLGGKGMLTVQSGRTGKHRTFSLTKPAGVLPPTIMVEGLIGPELASKHSWTHVGLLMSGDARTPGPDSLLVPWRFETWSNPRGIHAAARWFFARVGAGLDGARDVLEQATVWHEGTCGRCGFTLTRPDSIEAGLGPVCILKDI